MIAPLFGTKSALDHPTDRPAILRIFLSDRYPLFIIAYSIRFRTSPDRNPDCSSPLRPASAERFRRRPRTSARATHARLRQTLPVFRPKYTPIIRNDTNVPSFPPKFRLLPYRSCDGTGRSERPCGASLRPLSPPAGGGTETPGMDTGSERSPPDVFPAPGAGNLNFT